MSQSLTSLEQQLLALTVEAARKRPEGSVSLRELASHLHIPLEKTDHAFKSLEKQGLIELRELLDGFYVAIPTPLGDKQYAHWKAQRNIKLIAPLNKVGTIVLGALLTATLTFAMWYLGFSPGSTTIMPREEQVPIKIYYPEERQHLDTMWVVNDTEAMKNSISASNAFYDAHFPDATAASLSGEWYYEFDIENTSKLSQVNLREVMVEFTWEPISDTVEIYKNPRGLGGGIIKELKVKLAPNASGKPQVRILPAVPVDGAQFDYIYLSPGERETVKLNLLLSSPGRYQITPIARFASGDHTSEQRLENISLVYPKSYRLWFTSDNGHGKLVSYPFMVNRTKGNVRLDNLVMQPSSLPFVFETAVADEICKIFLVEGSLVMEIASTGQLMSCWGKLRWSEDGSAIIHEDAPPLDDARAVRVDLATGAAEDLGPISSEVIKPLPEEQRAHVETQYGTDYSDPFWSPRENHVALVIEDPDSKEWNLYESGKLILVNTETSSVVEIKSPEWCDSPSWSPSGQKIAFLCRTLNPEGYLSTESDVWIADVISGDAHLISQKSGYYQDLSWSEDETSVLVGGNGASIFYADTALPSIIIFELPYDCWGCISNPKWKPSQ